MLKFHHQRGYKPGNWSIEFWPGDEQWRSSLHLNWNWKGRNHWLCIFLPELSLKRKAKQ
jgi:hypothetical protein